MWSRADVTRLSVHQSAVALLQDYRRHGGEHMGTCLQGFELQDLTNDALREAAAGPFFVS